MTTTPLCIHCGAEIPRGKSRPGLYAARLFCSRRCNGLYRTAQRDKQRLATASRCAVCDGLVIRASKTAADEMGRPVYCGPVCCGKAGAAIAAAKRLSASTAHVPEPIRATTHRELRLRRLRDDLIRPLGTIDAYEARTRATQVLHGDYADQDRDVARHVLQRPEVQALRPVSDQPSGAMSMPSPLARNRMGAWM